MKLLFLIILSLLLSSAGAYFIAKNGRRFKLIDYPNERSSHTTPIPKGGAIGMLLAFIFTGVFFKIPQYFLETIILYSILGFFADRFTLSSKFRLLIQFICGFFFLFMIGLPILSFQNLILMGLLLIFIVGTTNIYNFMDGINGIAAITGIVGFGLLAFFSYQHGINDITNVISLCIVFSCIGFLPYNVPRAKVFMGDVGSALLGSSFACLAIITSRSILDFVCICSFLFPFYADEIITMYVRLHNKENLLQAHRKHFYQFLANSLKIKHWKISVAYGFAQGIIGIIVILLRPFGILVIAPALLALFITFAFFVFLSYNKYPGEARSR